VKTAQIRVTWKRGKTIAYPSPKLSVGDTQDSYNVRSPNNVRCVGWNSQLSPTPFCV